MKKRAALYLFGTVFVVLVAAIAFVQSAFFEEILKEEIQRRAAANLAARVTVDRLRVRLLTLQPRIELFDVAVFPRYPGEKKPAKEPSFQAARVGVYFRVLQLMASRVDIDRFEIEDPHLDLVQKNGKWVGLPAGLFIESPAASSPADETFQYRYDAFLIRNGILHLSAEHNDLQLGLTQIDALGTFEGNGSIVIDVAADGRRVSMSVGEDWFEEFVQSVSGQVIVGKDEIEVRGAKVETDSLSIVADGTIGLGKKTDIQFSRLHAIGPLEWVQRIVPDAPGMEGELTWRGSIGVDPNGFRVRGLAKVDDYWLHGFHLGATEADVDVTSDRARIKRLRIGGAGGKVEGPVDLTWPDGNLAISAELALANARFARVLDLVGIPGSHVDMGLNGRVAFAGGLSPLSLTGTADLRHDAFTWRNRPWNEAGPVTPNLEVPAGDLTGSFKLTYDGLRFERIAATAGSTGIAFEGDLHFLGATDIRFVAAPLDFGEIGQIAGVKLRGSGPVSGRVHGKFEEILLETELDVAGMNVAGFDFGRGTGPLRFSVAEFTISSTGMKFVRGQSAYEGPWKIDLNGSGSLAFDVTTQDARIEDMSDIVFADLEASKHAQGKVSGRFALRGPFDRLNGTYDLRGTDLAVAGERFLAYRGSGRWRDGAIWLDDFVASKASGAQLYARGSLGVAPDGDTDGLGGPINIEAHTASFALEDLDAVGPDGALTSEAALRLHLGGRFYRPELRGRLDLTGTRLHGQPLGASQVNFETVAEEPGGPRDRLKLDGILAGGSVRASSSIHLKNIEELPLTAELIATRLNIKPYFIAFNSRIAKDAEVKALASGVVSVRGDLWDLGGATFDVKANQLVLQRGSHQLRNVGDLVLVMAPQGLELRKVRLESEGGAEPFEVAGGTKDGRTDIRATGPIDLAFVELVTDAFSRIEGTVRVIDMRVHGKETLDYTGTAQLAGGTFKVRGFPVGPEGVAANISVKDRRVQISEVRGTLGGGTFGGLGEIILDEKRLGVTRYDMDFRLQAVNLRFPSESFSARASGDLTFGGLFVDGLPELKGDLTLHEARYTGPIEWKAQTVAFRTGSSIVTVDNTASRILNLNITMRADDNVRVQNDLGQLEFRTSPTISLVGDNTAFGIIGDLELVRGRIIFFDRVFALTKAEIDFLSSDQIDFHYDVTAEAPIRDWQVRLSAKGRRSRGEPDIKVDSNPPLSREDILLLVLTGQTAQEQKASGQDVATALALLGSTLGQGLGEQRGVTSKLKQALNLDSFEISPSYTANGSIGIKATGRWVLTDDLTVSSSVGSSDRMTAGIQADYRLSRRVHLVGGWSNEEQDSTPSAEQEAINRQGDWSVDARFRFEWK